MNTACKWIRFRLTVTLALGCLLVLGSPLSAQGGSVGQLPPVSRARWASIQDSLENRFVASRDPAERRKIIINVSGMGKYPDTLDGVAMPGVVASLRRIYSRAGVHEREIIASSLASQRERQEALEFLSELVVSPDDGLTRDIGSIAIATLLRLGEEGRAVLRQAYASGAGTELVRKGLERLAAADFRRPPGR